MAHASAVFARLRAAFTLFAAILALGGYAVPASADGLTLTDANDVAHPLTYTAGPFVVPTSQAPCDAGGQSLCSDTPLTIAVTPGGAAGKRVVVRIDWGQPVESDFDLYVRQGNNAVATSAGSTDPEIARFAPINGVYLIHVEPYQPYGNSFTASIYLEPEPTTAAAPSGPSAAFQIFAPPSGMANGGEPSIGANWSTGTAVVGNASEALFINFDDSKSPATATWVNRAPPTNVTSADPILFTDVLAGHTIVSQLVTDGTVFAAGCSLSSVTDDDGITWVPSEGCGPPAGADHQGIGGGPHHAPLIDPPAPLYSHAVYYCAQSVGGVIGDATCSRSDDGGITYGPAVLVYTSQCGGIHGHPRVAPDGTVYLPNRTCAGAADGGGPGALGQGIAISTDNGLNWTYSLIPGSTPSASDPSIAAGLNDTGKDPGQASNTIYFGYCDGDGLAKMAVSHDQGQHWVNIFNVGAAGGIQNCVFPEVIAGDDNRAAFFFLGTTAPGAYQSNDFHGEWHAYVAMTYDGGKSWGLTDTTPTDPVQLGPICQMGIACNTSGPLGNTRNLLDFNDITLDKQGRVLFVFTDGCVAPVCVPGASPKKSRKAQDTVGRQSGGRTLFAANDPAPQVLPEGSGHLLSGALPPSFLVLFSLAALRRRRR